MKLLWLHSQFRTIHFVSCLQSTLIPVLFPSMALHVRLLFCIVHCVLSFYLWFLSFFVLLHWQCREKKRERDREGQREREWNIERVRVFGHRNICLCVWVLSCQCVSLQTIVCLCLMLHMHIYDIKHTQRWCVCAQHLNTQINTEINMCTVYCVYIVNRVYL